MATWTQDRIEEFNAMLAEWAVTLTIDESTGSAVTLTAQAIASPFQDMKPMDRTGFQQVVRQPAFDMFTSEFARLNLGVHRKFKSNGIIFQITQVGTDEAEPTTRFYANKIQ